MIFLSFLPISSFHLSRPFPVNLPNPAPLFLLLFLLIIHLNTLYSSILLPHPSYLHSAPHPCILLPVHTLIHHWSALTLILPSWKMPHGNPRLPPLPDLLPVSVTPQPCLCVPAQCPASPRAPCPSGPCRPSHCPTAAATTATSAAGRSPVRPSARGTSAPCR